MFPLTFYPSYFFYFLTYVTFIDTSGELNLVLM